MSAAVQTLDISPVGRVEGDLDDLPGEAACRRWRPAFARHVGLFRAL